MSQIRYDYLDESVFEKKNSTRRHNDILGNIFFLLRNRLKSYRYSINFESVKVEIKEKQLYAYPDIVISKKEIEAHPEIIRQPVVIIEVLPDTNDISDRIEKFKAYQFIDSLQCYILVHQKKWGVEIFINKNDEWYYRFNIDTEDIIDIPSLNIKIPLKDIYENAFYDEEAS